MHDYSKAGLDKFKLYYEDFKTTTEVRKVTFMDRIWNWLGSIGLSFVSPFRALFRANLR